MTEKTKIVPRVKIKDLLASFQNEQELIDYIIKEVKSDSELQEIEEKGKEIEEFADMLDIQSNSDTLPIAKNLTDIEIGKKFIKKKFDRITKPADRVHKVTTSLRGDYLKTFEDAEKTIKDKNNEWTRKQRLIEEEKRKKLELQAEKRAEKKRDDLVEKGKNAIDKGDDLKAQHYLERSDAVVEDPVFVKDALPEKIETDEGKMSTKMVLKLKITDRDEFIKHAAGSLLLIDYLNIDEKGLEKFLQKHTKLVTEIPGIELVEEYDTKVRLKKN